MKNQVKYLSLLAGAGAVFAILSCKPSVTSSGSDYVSPTGYDFNHPVKYNMPDALQEISGIAFHHGKNDVIYAEEDQHGRVYALKPGDKTAKYMEFRETGDFEDMAICGDEVVMLQSKGRLFTFPFADVSSPKVQHLQKFENMLPQGEYEGMYADEASRQVYVLCKHCEMDKTSKQTSGFIFKLSNDGKISASDTFKINVKHIAEQTNMTKVSFHPSALAQNPRSKEWYVLSSVNKMLVILSEKWKVRQVFRLNPATFPQPEGIAFDDQNNLYISNEGNKLDPGNVLKFTYATK